MLVLPKVLLISSDETESNALDNILSEYVVLQHARNLSELESILEGGDYDAVLCGQSFQGGACDAALENVRQRCPNPPVIIFCQTGGEQEWIEVLQAGAFDLLLALCQKSTVLPVPEQAVVSFEPPRQHNDMLNRMVTAS